MGTFIVKDDKIVRWTDYWDTGLLAKMMAGEDYSELIPSY
jgi:limonene-1,2-epoxide hydrolase